jgi:hypothetical protein
MEVPGVSAKDLEIELASLAMIWYGFRSQYRPRCEHKVHFADQVDLATFSRMVCSALA